VERAFLRGLLALVAALTAFLLTASPASAATRPRVLVVHFAADINPVTQDFVNHQIDRAGKGGYSAVVILLDTHGGLVSSMEKIYEKELASKVPVIVYIAPQGAAALSAGVFVAEAADLLAMAPVTNLGSSTPILPTGNLPSDARRKAINHLSAKLRALMGAHGRNKTWADAAVRVASNLTADEALRMHVVDTVAHDLPALLRQIDGRKTKPNGYVLHTANAELVNARMGFFARLLNVLIDPNILTLLFLAGIAGIGFEIFHPGAVLPGGLGAVALVTALFGFSILPISWGGLTLLLLGIVLLVIDAHVTSHGAISVAGLACLAVGAIMLFRNAPAPYHTSVPLVVGITVSLGAFWAIAIGKAVQVRRRPVEVGVHELVGVEGEVRREGLVFVRGELWQANAADGEPLRPGDRVRVEGVDGLRLTVRHVPAAAAVS
jgi:membrane-bound serine protease (ClpP class)